MKSKSKFFTTLLIIALCLSISAQDKPKTVAETITDFGHAVVEEYHAGRATKELGSEMWEQLQKIDEANGLLQRAAADHSYDRKNFVYYTRLAEAPEVIKKAIAKLDELVVAVKSDEARKRFEAQLVLLKKVTKKILD
jgi:hypothetical protein